MANTNIDKAKFVALLGNTQQAQDFVDSFSLSDILIFQLYYKWITTQIAKNAGIVELITDEKRRQEYMQTYGAADWQFSGVVDHLYQGATHCMHAGEASTGGHSLRYAYYAYSPSINKELVFGRDCMGKFLGVDVAVLNKMQSILLAADKEVAEALSYGRFSTKLQSSVAYTMLFAIKTNERLSTVFTKLLGRTATELFLNFINAGFVLPKKLDNLVTEAFTLAAKDVIWGKTKLSIFSIDSSEIVRDYACLTLTTYNETKELYPWDISLSLDLSFLVQVPLRQLLNCLSLNSYIQGVDFIRKEVNAETFLTNLNDLNRYTKEFETTFELCDTVSYSESGLYDYLTCDSGEFSAYITGYADVEVDEPTAVFLYCYLHNKTKDYCLLYDAKNSLALLRILNYCMPKAIEVLKGCLMNGNN